ncbi:MAG: ABC transporter permease [Vallitalea sp.]|jgi:simple sugar transport system permease protein|nr:ABC transporter permease [Vallitalea sp.]
MSNKWFDVIRTAVALAVTLVLTLIIIFLVSEEPLYALKLFLTGPMDSFRHIGNIFEMAIPLVFTGLGLSIIFQSSQFNISASGAFVIGAVATTLSAIFLPIGGIVGTLISLLIGGVVGACFSLIPGILKVKWDTSELVTSLMLNYVLYSLGSYIINNYVRDVNAGGMVSVKFQESIILPRLVNGTRVHYGLIIAIIAIIASYYFLYRTKWGYEIRMTGLNSEFAKYSGITIAKAALLAQLVGGLLAGLGGSVETLGMYRRYQWQVVPSFGFDGIIVAIMAKNNPAYVPVAAVFLAYLRIGADIMSRSADVPSEVITIIQAVVIMLLVAESFLSKWRYKRVVKATMSNKEA